MMYVYLQKVVSKKNFLKISSFLLASWVRTMTKIAGFGSGRRSISQRHGSADQDPDPDPPQNVMDPQHRFKNSSKKTTGQPTCPAWRKSLSRPGVATSTEALRMAVS